MNFKQLVFFIVFFCFIIQFFYVFNFLNNKTINSLTNTNDKNIPILPTQIKNIENSYCPSLQAYNFDIKNKTKVYFSDKTKHAFIANVNSIFIHPPDKNKYYASDEHYNWFVSNLNHWEMVTFLLFKTLIKPHMVYVGFGEWIGPTILYSSQLAKQSFGLEPDNIAFKNLALNAMANNCFDGKLTLFPNCIYIKDGFFEMKDAIGGSGASLKFTDNDIAVTGGNYQLTKCFTLESFLLNQSITDEPLFIKVDSEGAEANLFHDFNFLTSKLKYKPVWLISKHVQKKYGESYVMENIISLKNKYKCAKSSSPSHLTGWSPEKLKTFSISELPDISTESITVESNPDFILVDEHCSVVDKWIKLAIDDFIY